MYKQRCSKNELLDICYFMDIKCSSKTKKNHVFDYLFKIFFLLLVFFFFFGDTCLTFMCYKNS